MNRGGMNEFLLLPRDFRFEFFAEYFSKGLIERQFFSEKYIVLVWS